MPIERKLWPLTAIGGHCGPAEVMVHSMGGIGNQLFILGGSLVLAEQLGCRLLVDPSLHQKTPKLPFLLDRLIAAADLSLQSAVVTLQEPQSVISRRALRATIPRCCTFTERSFAFDERLFQQRRGSCIFGYLQSWRYMKELSEPSSLGIRDAIRTLAQNPQPPWSARDIVLHVRRGDYLNPGVTEVHGVLQHPYYLAAVRDLRYRGFDGDVWVVAQDELDDRQQWTNAFGSPIRQIQGSSIWHDLALLMAAPNLVIANSTFSWMGGWLGDHDRPVYAPHPWFRTTAHDTADLIPPGWIVLEHEF